MTSRSACLSAASIALADRGRPLPQNKTQGFVRPEQSPRLFYFWLHPPGRTEEWTEEASEIIRWFACYIFPQIITSPRPFAVSHTTPTWYNTPHSSDTQNIVFGPRPGPGTRRGSSFLHGLQRICHPDQKVVGLPMPPLLLHGSCCFRAHIGHCAAPRGGGSCCRPPAGRLRECRTLPWPAPPSLP